MKVTAKCTVPNFGLVLVLFIASYLSSMPVTAAEDRNSTASPTAIRDLTLTPKEKRFLEQFKDIVKPFLQNQPGRFREEAYLIRWLRATEFDIKKAEKKLSENLRWREKHRMDRILDEDWSAFSSDLPYSISSYDKQNQPILIIQFGNWDIRKFIVSGKRDQLLRYINRILEGLDHAIYKQQAKGFPITRGSEIVDLAGFNLYQQGCLQCIPVYLEAVLGLDAHYPALMEKIVLVNAPGVFEAILNTIKPAMAPETRNSMFVFGTNSKAWKAFLNTFMSADQLPVELGGKKVSHEFNAV